MNSRKKTTVSLDRSTLSTAPCFGPIHGLLPHRSLVQPKLTMGQPGDKYERQADRIVGAFIGIQLPAEPNQFKEGLGKVRDTEVFEHITPMVEGQTNEEKELDLQVNTADTQIREAAADLESRIHSRKGMGQSLPGTVRTFFEQCFHCDFGRVRVHTDAEANMLNRTLRSWAFTVGHDIFFHYGQYKPGTASGRELLAHELTHVIQQNGEVRRKLTDNLTYEQKTGSIAGESVRDSQFASLRADESRENVKAQSGVEYRQPGLTDVGKESLNNANPIGAVNLVIQRAIPPWIWVTGAAWRVGAGIFFLGIYIPQRAKRAGIEFGLASRFLSGYADMLSDLTRPENEALEWSQAAISSLLDIDWEKEFKEAFETHMEEQDSESLQTVFHTGAAFVVQAVNDYVRRHGKEGWARLAVEHREKYGRMKGERYRSYKNMLLDQLHGGKVVGVHPFQFE